MIKKIKPFIKIKQKITPEETTEKEIMRLSIFTILLYVFLKTSNDISFNYTNYGVFYESFKQLSFFFLSIPLLLFIIYVLLLGIKYTYIVKINIPEVCIQYIYDISILFLGLFGGIVIFTNILGGIMNKSSIEIGNFLFIGYFIFLGIFIIIGYFIAVYKVVIDLKKIVKKQINPKDITKNEYFQFFIWGTIFIIGFLMIKFKLFF